MSLVLVVTLLSRLRCLAWLLQTALPRRASARAQPFSAEATAAPTSGDQGRVTSEPGSRQVPVVVLLLLLLQLLSRCAHTTRCALVLTHWVPRLAQSRSARRPTPWTP